MNPILLYWNRETEIVDAKFRDYFSKNFLRSRDLGALNGCMAASALAAQAGPAIHPMAVLLAASLVFTVDIVPQA